MMADSTLAISVLPTPASPSRKSGHPSDSARWIATARLRSGYVLLALEGELNVVS
jgi:hypothetical protein